MPNRIIEKVGRVSCVPIDFWKGESPQKKKGAKPTQRKPIMEGETESLPTHRLTLINRVILNLTTTSEPKILACAAEIELAWE